MCAVLRLDVDRALDERREDRVVREARRDGADALELAPGLPGLALVASSPRARRATAAALRNFTVWWPSGAREGSASVGVATSSHGDVVGVAVVAQRALVVDDLLRPAG